MKLVFSSLIRGSAPAIFDLLSDMPNYGRWLPGSPAFGGTTQVSPYPVRLGTTYLDAGPAGERPGSVIEFEPPTRLGFHQTMDVKRGPVVAKIDIVKRFMLQPANEATLVNCALELEIETRGLSRFARPLLIVAFRKENARVLAELKRYVEA